MKAAGSFTVEAALVVPIVLFSILLLMNQGISLYERVVKTEQEQDMWEGFDMAGRFQNLELLDDALK